MKTLLAAGTLIVLLGGILLYLMSNICIDGKCLLVEPNLIVRAIEIFIIMAVVVFGVILILLTILGRK